MYQMEVKKVKAGAGAKKENEVMHKMSFEEHVDEAVAKEPWKTSEKGK